MMQFVGSKSEMRPDIRAEADAEAEAEAEAGLHVESLIVKGLFTVKENVEPQIYSALVIVFFFNICRKTYV